MRKVVAGLLGASLVTGGIAIPTTASAAPPVEPAPALQAQDGMLVDDLPHAAERKRRALREQAVADVVSGKLKPQKRNGSTVAKVGRTNGSGATNRAVPASGQDQYVELSRERTDRIFVILAEFGDERDPRFPDRDTTPTTAGPVRYDGPLHNQIPEPDRAVDNSTIWQPEYNRDHFQQLYFGSGDGVESVKTYFETQSSGRYSVDGTVTDWVKVKHNQARYGRSNDNPNDANGDDPNVCSGNVCTNVYDLVRDASNQWVADQRAAGRTQEQIVEELKSFDVYDRYDFDHDGNFNEPDGYLDHFQIVHAGGDQADGDPVYGEDAIWSHRSFVYQSLAGSAGPGGNLAGGTPIADTGLWIGDYTMQPENGGLSVFVHEYGHDLGLPDDYDTSGLGDNNNEHWTLMAQSRLNAEGEPIGTRPGDLGAWNKLQLGWLDYETLVPGEKRTINLGPSEYNSERPQAAVVVLPDKQVVTQHGAPFAGQRQFYSGNSNNTSTSMTREIDLTGATSGSVTLKGRYSIELDYDYLYFEASTDDGTTWTRLPGTVGGAAFPTDGSGNPAITGTSNGQWVDIAVPLDAYAGQKIQFRLHYKTDAAVAEGGFFGDEVTVNVDGTAVSTDGAEGTSTWTLNGFSIRAASTTQGYDNFYIAAHRSYVSYDRYLKTGPYYFGYSPAKPDLVDHYPYQEGLLISYWDTSVPDNNTNVHPGSGRNLYVDARPRPLRNIEGMPWRARVQMYDATFGLEKADSFTLHVGGKASYVRGQDAQPVFNDTKKYFFDELPNHGVKLPAVGVKIRVVSVDGTTMKVRFS